MTLEEELEDLLKYHDWWHVYSDMHAVFLKGWKERDRIMDLVKILGDEGKKLYNKYAPNEQKLSITEENLSKEEEDTKNQIFNKLKTKKRDFVKKYGKEAERVMMGKSISLARKTNEIKLKDIAKNIMKNGKK